MSHGQKTHDPDESALIAFLGGLGLLCSLPPLLSPAPWWSAFLLASLLYFGWYAVAVGLLQPRARPSLCVAWIYTTLGAVALGVLVQWARKLGLPLVTVPAFACLGGAFVLGSRRSLCLPIRGERMALSRADVWGSVTLLLLMAAVPTALSIGSGAGITDVTP